METYLAQALQNDAALAALFANRPSGDPWFYEASSLGVGEHPAKPELPYFVWNELPSTPFIEVEKVSNAQRRVFAFYVYDVLGDYGRINQALREVRRVVKGLAPFITPEGVRCSASTWRSISGLITDDGYACAIRFGTGEFVVSD